MPPFEDVFTGAKESDLRAAETFFHEKIPLTRAMGVRVVPHGDTFAVQAPVELNHNHLHTAFGGSINSVATLAGYAFLWLAIRETGAQLVVQHSSIRFLRPLHQVIRAVCVKPEPRELATFGEMVAAGATARITLRARVEENDALAAEFVGTFVALPSTMER